MNDKPDFSRRHIVQKMVVGLALGPMALTQAHAASESLISEDDPAAKALQYVADASRAKDAKPNQTCVNCSLYAGDSGSTQAACSILNNKLVAARGWCNSWTNM